MIAVALGGKKIFQKTNIGKIADLDKKCIISSVPFEFDPRKSESNRAKHGIDFLEIQKLWDGKVVATPSRNRAESRWLATGMLGSKYWTVIFTWRGNIIRIISARRSRKNEITNYQNI